MGIEKMAGSGAVPYQGSAAVSTAAAQGVDPAVQSKGIPALGNTTQGSSVNTGADENKGRAEELAGLNNKQLKNAVSDLNKRLTNSEAIFGIHEKTNRVTIKIVDKTTREVIKEYPPEQTLDMIAKVWEIAGILVDEKR
mgnify:CR=1 FL=1